MAILSFDKSVDEQLETPVKVGTIMRWIRWALEDYCRIKNEALHGYLFPNNFVPGLSDNKWSADEILLIASRLGETCRNTYTDMSLCPHCAVQVDVRHDIWLEASHCEKCLYGQTYGPCLYFGAGENPFSEENPQSQYAIAKQQIADDLGYSTVYSLIKTLQAEHNAACWEKMKKLIAAMNYMSDCLLHK